MTFRFANVDGRSALVDTEGWWFDASSVSRGVISGDPMRAWIQLDQVHRAANTVQEREPDGNVSDAHLGPPIPHPGVCSLSASTTDRMPKSPRWISPTCR